jgi:hypothetical protein
LTSTGSPGALSGVPGVAAKAKEAREEVETAREAVATVAVETAGPSGEAQMEATLGCNRCTLHPEPIVKTN